jgi:transcriptional regulator with XRE-family HTH domain
MNEITPGDIAINLGLGLRRRRLAQHLRLVDVAERSGLSVPTIRSIERGDGYVSFGSYAFVAVLLGAGDLFDPILRDVPSSAFADAASKRSRVSRPKRKGTR